MNIEGVEISVDNLDQGLLELLVGERWPNGNADEMRSLASTWNDIASQLDEIRQIATSAARQVDQYCQGANADAFQSFWSANFDDGKASWLPGVAPAALPFAVQFCKTMASALNAGADQIETTKDTIMGNIAILVATVAPQIVGGFFDLGATDATAIAEILADRITLQGILDAAKDVMIVIVEQAIEQGLLQAELNFAIQFKEMMEGHARGINWSEVERSGIGGAEGGAFGAAFGLGLGKLSGMAFGDDIGGSAVANMAIGVASGSLTNASIDLIQNGKISGSDFTKGSLAAMLGGVHGAEAATGVDRPIDTADLPAELTHPQIPEIERSPEDLGQAHLSELPTTLAADSGTTPESRDAAGATRDPSHVSTEPSSIARILAGDDGGGVAAGEPRADSSPNAGIDTHDYAHSAGSGELGSARSKGSDELATGAGVGGGDSVHPSEGFASDSDPGNGAPGRTETVSTDPRAAADYGASSASGTHMADPSSHAAAHASPAGPGRPTTQNPAVSEPVAHDPMIGPASAAHEIHSARPADARPGHLTAQHHDRVQQAGEGHRVADGPGPAPQGHTGHSLTADSAPAREARKDQSDEVDTNRSTQTFLLLCTEYSAKRGGVVVFNRALAEGLADAGHNVVVRIGEDASPYADVQRPNLRILGPKDILPPDIGPDGAKVQPDARDFIGPEHDPEGMPEHVDYVVGHTRFSGKDAKNARDANYPEAKLIHFVHMVPEALGRVKENGDPPEPGEGAKGIENHIIERGLVADADLAIGVGPAITDNIREMVAQARDMEAQGGKPVMTQAVHEFVPGMEFRDRGERSTEGRPLKVLLFGRTDVGQKGGKAAAEVVSRLRAEGLPVELVVRGVPPLKVAWQTRVLREIMDSADVDVRPFTVERSDLHADFDDADVMIMTSRAEGFGLTAQEAAAAGVPVVVPSGSGFGRWLGESGQFPDGLTSPSIVEQRFEDQVPVDAWVDALRNVVQEYPAAQQRALDLQQEFKDQKVTWGTAVASMTEEAKGLR